MTALGVSLLVGGALLILVEAHVPTLGVLGGPGVIMLAVGAVLAVSGVGGGILLGVLIAVALAAASVGVVALSLRKGLTVRRRRVRTGAEGMLGHVGVVRTWDGNAGSVACDGALWRARRSWLDEEFDLNPGDEVVIERLDGLTLAVRPAEEWELTK